jgi:hypothetical protein
VHDVIAPDREEGLDPGFSHSASPGCRILYPHARDVLDWDARRCRAIPSADDPLRKMAGILMFPVMLPGPALSAILLIWNVAVRASVGARG